MIEELPLKPKKRTEVAIQYTVDPEEQKQVIQEIFEETKQKYMEIEQDQYIRRVKQYVCL